MICPRCGVINPAGNPSCSRCAGSLAPPPERDDRPLPPVVPLTRRAELQMMRAKAAEQVSAGPPPARPSEDEQADSGLYLLSSERSTGQPEPPGGQHAEAGASPSQPAQRNDRFLPRLSPAP